MMRENPFRARTDREHLVSIKKKTHLRKKRIFKKNWRIRESGLILGKQISSAS